MLVLLKEINVELPKIKEELTKVKNEVKKLKDNQRIISEKFATMQCILRHLKFLFVISKILLIVVGEKWFSYLKFLNE